MTAPDHNADANRGPLSGLPLIRQLSPEARQGAQVGLLSAGGVLLLLGGLLGGLNRGPSGILIGAASGAALGIMFGAVSGMILGVLLPAKQARAALNLVIEGVGGRFSPGDELSGHLELTAHNTFVAQGGKVYFICRGFYAHDGAGPNATPDAEGERETRQYLIQQVELVPAGVIRRNANLRYPFRFDVPTDALPTHHGYACAIHWTLHAVLEAPGEGSIRTQQELYVRSRPTSLVEPESGYRSGASSGQGQLVLTLPHAVYAEGEAIRGEAYVSPMASFQADEVRAVLLRIEHTPIGSGHTVYVGESDPTTGQFRGRRQPGGEGTTYVWLEDETKLSNGYALEVGRPVNWPFKLIVPTHWRPTLSTKDGKVTWKVGFVISSEDREDLRSFHEVIVHTGPPHLDRVLLGERDSDRARPRPARRFTVDTT